MGEKNPYAELATILRALPEDRRYLLHEMLKGFVPGVEHWCGCAFGVTYPNVKDLDESDVVVVYDDGDQAEEDLDDPTDREIDALIAARAFRRWVNELGGDHAFVEDVMYENDGFKPYDNTREACSARYDHVLAHLDLRAGEWGRP